MSIENEAKLQPVRVFEAPQLFIETTLKTLKTWRECSPVTTDCCHFFKSRFKSQLGYWVWSGYRLIRPSIYPSVNNSRKTLLTTNWVWQQLHATPPLCFVFHAVLLCCQLQWYMESLNEINEQIPTQHPHHRHPRLIVGPFYCRTLISSEKHILM